jgi:hypothetical protein
MEAWKLGSLETWKKRISAPVAVQLTRSFSKPFVSAPKSGIAEIQDCPETLPRNLAEWWARQGLNL